MSRPGIFFTVIAVMMLYMSSAAWADVAADHKRAMDLFSASRFKDAEPAFVALIPKLQGQQAIDAQYRLGMIYLRQYKLAQTIEAFNTLLGMPDVPTRFRGVAHYQIGVAHALGRKYEDAIAACQRVRQEPGVDDEEVALSWLFPGALAVAAQEAT